MSRFEDPYRNDTYQELASIRANTQASVAFQALQTGLLAQMSGSMNGIQAEMANVRQQQSEALAIQQELLNREQIQGHLEEFVFQAEKLVVECSKTRTDIPASSRYFLLMGVLGKIKKEGIGTPIIKGRENKAAFEKVVSETKRLTQQLSSEPEVKEAIEWAEAEREKKIAEQKKLNARRIQEQRERQASVKKLEQQIQSLQVQLKTVPTKDVAIEWWERAKPKLPTWEKDKVKFILMIWLGLGPALLGSPLVLVGLVLEANKRTTALNHDLNQQIASLKQQLAELHGGVSSQE